MKQQTIPNAGQIVKAARKNTTTKLRVTVFPDGGGQPYEEDVVPDEKGLFTLRDVLSFKVTRGSVWVGRDGVLRAFCHEGNPQTISLAVLKGDVTFHPMELHETAENNRIAQAHAIAKSGGMWKNAGTWGIVLVGIGIIVALVLVMKSVSDGAEAIRQTLDAMQVQAGGSTPADAAGHQPIAPGGR